MTNKKWNRIRTEGRMQYSMTDGLLVKGGTYLTAFCASSPVVFGDQGAFVEALPTAAIALPAAGFATNMAMWRVYEYMFEGRKNILRKLKRRYNGWKRNSRTRRSQNSNIKTLRPKTA